MIEKNVSNEKVMLWPIEAQYPGLSLPDTWESIDDFVKWYMELKKPMIVPFDSTIITTDDATAVTLFRHGEYQVELYLAHPGEIIPLHSHPGMEAVTVIVGGGTVCGPESLHRTSKYAGVGAKLIAGDHHGGTLNGSGNGFALLTFERWLYGITPSSAALQWKGETAGPIHDALLMRFYPGATDVNGYFDVTKYQPEYFTDL